LVKRLSMEQEFRKREEEEELVRQFEEALKRKSATFFDLEAFETIIYYYMDRAKHKKALLAVQVAITQYPYSTELIAVKAQVLSNLQQYDEALELLEEAINLHPGDLDIMLSMGSICITTWASLTRARKITQKPSSATRARWKAT
jgi:tetratricopeptide (TPR) repeat protein